MEALRRLKQLWSCTQFITTYYRVNDIYERGAIISFTSLDHNNKFTVRKGQIINFKMTGIIVSFGLKTEIIYYLRKFKRLCLYLLNQST